MPASYPLLIQIQPMSACLAVKNIANNKLTPNTLTNAHINSLKPTLQTNITDENLQPTLHANTTNDISSML